MKEHIASSGDCMNSIALEHGFFWQTLWNLGENGELRSRRRDPNVLHADDIVRIPDLRAKSESRAPEARHRFRRKGVPATLNVRLLKHEQPRRNVKYLLEVDGTVISGQTDSDGWIHESIAPNARRGALKIAETGEAYELMLGHLPPVDTTPGQQARLKNLGYFAGPVDGIAGSSLQAAIRAFQSVEGLPVTGDADSQTEESLKRAHGS